MKFRNTSKVKKKKKKKNKSPTYYLWEKMKLCDTVGYTYDFI